MAAVTDTGQRAFNSGTVWLTEDGRHIIRQGRAVVNDGEFVWGMATAYTLTAEVGLFALTGQDVTFTYTPGSGAAAVVTYRPHIGGRRR